MTKVKKPFRFVFTDGDFIPEKENVLVLDRNATLRFLTYVKKNRLLKQQRKRTIKEECIHLTDTIPSVLSRSF